MRDLSFRSLDTLLQGSHPYVKRFKQDLDSIHENLATHLDQTPTLNSTAQSAVLEYLLSLACQTQNILNIELGRAGLLALPREWLITHLESAAGPLLESNDEWEYRRLLEVTWKLNSQLVRRFVLRGIKYKQRSCGESIQPEVTRTFHQIPVTVQSNRLNITSRFSTGNVMQIGKLFLGAHLVRLQAVQVN
ncbi:MAG: hypothetical protein L0346_11720 [Chloroflexi bacterium]|nr:hypothetical protein [Chloroflexota bacterium]